MTCPGCNARLKLKPELAGRKGRCPKCRSAITAPTAETRKTDSSTVQELAQHHYSLAAPPAPTLQEMLPAVMSSVVVDSIRTAERSLKQVMKELLRGFDGELDRPRPQPAYLLFLGPVALCMIALPILYVLFVAAVGWMTYLYAIHGLDYLGSALRVSWISLLLYVAPLVSGGILLLFLLKPLFARSAPESRKIVIQRGEQPLLWAFVERIARAVQAPVPSQIVFDCEANASAGFRRGWRSFFSHDLSLTIGLPLVYGLSTEQLAGVLAHELGHFSQGVGMRLSYVIRRVNYWFARIVGQRDSWDDALDEWTQESEFAVVTLTCLLAQLCVFVTRLILFVFLAISEAISSHLLRLGEYHADRFEAALVGPKVFQSTMNRLALLSLANLRALEVIQESWGRSELPENFPELIEAIARLEQKPLTKIAKKYLRREERSLFSSHPTVEQRVAAVNKLGHEGIFRFPAPATILLRELALISRQATFELYYLRVARKIPMDKLKSTETILSKYLLGGNLV